MSAGCKKRAGSSKRTKYLQIETGATGLEPATSGVTGRESASTAENEQ
jgi:hypothetical protein